MKISLRWLQDFVEVKEYLAQPVALAEVLTSAGLEVEEIQDRAKDFQHVVVGLILEKDKHPNADKLSVCRVTTGEGVVHQIVCGAQNHKSNDKVVVALPGAVLPGNFEIKHSVIRGVESGGMLCSKKELGLAGESDGLFILPESANIGENFAKHQGMDDVTFELKVTPNRADCLSHYGLAREISCLLNRPLKTMENKIQAKEDSTQKRVGLEVKAKDLCPRYTGRFISEVKVGPSPEWLKNRLESVGINSINNIVDATNYVMMELGQPLHAFDANEIRGAKIVVDRAKEGERFVTLDGTELVLKGQELMIKDTERSLCMAGVIGGKNSGVSEKTTQIFLEAAFFTPKAARQSARLHGLTTDSGYRFARGVDPAGTLKSLDRAASLIQQVAGGQIFSEPHDENSAESTKKPISIDVRLVSERMGYAANGSQLEDYLKRMGCEVTRAYEDAFHVTPPSFRFDLETEMDLVEEYARLYGYQHIPETLPALSVMPGKQDAHFLAQSQVSHALRASGFSQAMNYAFVGTAAQKLFLGDEAKIQSLGLKDLGEPVSLLNPLSEDLSVMRRSLVFGLWKNLVHNFHQGNEVGKVFEIGSVFGKTGESFNEQWRLSLVAWGTSTSLWNKTEVPLVYEIKGAIEQAMRSQGVESFRWIQPEKNQIPAFLHRGQALSLEVEGQRVGYLATVSPLLLDENKIRVPAAIAEIDFSTLNRKTSALTRTKSPSRFPIVQRDLALVMPAHQPTDQVSQLIKKEMGPQLIDLRIFDVFLGDKVGTGRKSVAFGLRLQDRNATLQDAWVNDKINSLLTKLKAELHIEVR